MLEIVTLEEAERRYVVAALEQLGGNISRTARLLDIDRRTLHRKLSGWGVRVATSRSVEQARGEAR